MKLNLGCGNDIKSGWTNLDIAPLEGIDVVHDLNVLPLPFDDGSFEEILCQDVLEHLDYIDLLRDIHRIMKPGGKLHIRVPHFTSRNNHIDPTHKSTFSIQTFQFFVKESLHDRGYYFDFHFSTIERNKLTFEKGPFIYNYPAQWLFNISKLKGVYEGSFLRNLFPAENILLTLVK